jgi:hypothetical protein
MMSAPFVCALRGAPDEELGQIGVDSDWPRSR